MTEFYDPTAEIIARGDAIRPHGDPAHPLTRYDLIYPDAWTDLKVVRIDDTDGLGPIAFYPQSLDLVFGPGDRELYTGGVEGLKFERRATKHLLRGLLCAESKSVFVETPHPGPWHDLWRARRP